MTQASLTHSYVADDTLSTLRAKPISLTVASKLEQSAEAKPLLPPAATSSEGATPVTKFLPDDTTQEDLVLSEVAGIVLNEAGESLLVRLEEQNLIVHFPRELISEELAVPGTAVTYQIVRRRNGMRYQRFVSRDVELDQDRVNEVLEELGKIRYRGK